MLLLTLSMSAAAYTNSAAKTTAAPPLPTTLGIIISCADSSENCGSQSDSSCILDLPCTEPAAIVAYGEYEAGTTSVVTFSALAGCGDESLGAPSYLYFDTVCESSTAFTGASFVATGIGLKWIHNPYGGEIGTTNAKWVLQVTLVGTGIVYLDDDLQAVVISGSITILCQQLYSIGLGHLPQGPAFYGQEDVYNQALGGVLGNSFPAEVGCSASIP